MIRSFLALDLSEAVRQNLGELIETVESQSRGIKWVRHENFHVTIKFFGNIDPKKMLRPIQNAVEEEVKGLPPVSLNCQGIGAFPKWERPRVIWAGLEGDVSVLLSLQRRLEDRFKKIGFPKENREFKMHLTIGRIKGRPQFASWMATLEKMPIKSYGTTVVDHLTLYKSQLTKGGAVYTAIKRFPFL